MFVFEFKEEEKKTKNANFFVFCECGFNFVPRIAGYFSIERASLHFSFSFISTQSKSIIYLIKYIEMPLYVF